MFFNAFAEFPACLTYVAAITSFARYLVDDVLSGILWSLRLEVSEGSAQGVFAAVDSSDVVVSADPPQFL